MGILNLRLDESLEQRLLREARLQNQTRSEIARTAIANELALRERRRFQAEILRAARARGDREAIREAEEALAAGNEALELVVPLAAEPKAAYAPRPAKPKKR